MANLWWRIAVWLDFMGHERPEFLNSTDLNFSLGAFGRKVLFRSVGHCCMSWDAKNQILNISIDNRSLMSDCRVHSGQVSIISHVEDKVVLVDSQHRGQVHLFNDQAKLNYKQVSGVLRSRQKQDYCCTTWILFFFWMSHHSN